MILSVSRMGFTSTPIKAPKQRHGLLRSRILLSCLIFAGLVLLYFQTSLLSRYSFKLRTSSPRLSQSQWDSLDAGLRRCAELQAPPERYSFPVSSERTNPRWTSKSGQKKPVLLQNVTLFDGDVFLSQNVDVLFDKGVIRTISPAGSGASGLEHEDIDIQELNGAFVTPGLIDMHSHHLVDTWPTYSATGDVNEIHPATGPVTPFVRALDSIKPYDQAATIIASGGVTSSLILPGSANIMGGEGVMVKNILRRGDYGEENVDELLLEHGVPQASRRRYMKMACGENPRRVHGHTRMGNAWIFRQHMARAKELRERQDAWCASAAAARKSGDYAAISALLAAGPDGKPGGLPEDLELDSTVAMLRGKIGVNIHCYEPEDLEVMIRHSKEFGFRIQAFHHSLSAWKVPELVKSSEEYGHAGYLSMGFRNVNLL